MSNFMNPQDYSGRSSSSSGSYGINTKIMIAAVVVLFMVVVFILLLHIYARWFWRRGRMGAARRRRRMRFDFATSEGIRSAQHTGLDQAILSTLPTFVYSKDKMGEDGYDCAVCLSEFEENESGTLIPQCNHRFHTSCIDMWFHSHNTCPLCRRSLDHHTDTADPAIILHIESGPRTPGAEFDPNMAIQQQQQQQQQHHEQQHVASAQNASQSSPNGVQYPPNVLFWGRANEGLSESNSTKQPSPHHLAIDIPRSSSTFSFTSDSPRSPLRSIRRLLSRDKRINHIEPGSPSCNVEDCSVQSDPSSHLPANPGK